MDLTPYRDYQLTGITALWQFFREHETGHPLVAMPTASGKSWVIGGFIRSMFDAWQASRVMAVTHEENLIKQNVAKLMKVWPNAPVGIYSAGLDRREHLMPITFAGIQSVHNKAALFGPVDILIIDEAHLVSPHTETMYRRLINQLLQLNPAMRIIGLSATCYRLGLGRLIDGGIFTHVCYDLTTPEAYAKLVRDGWLCPLLAVRTDYRVSIAGVGTRGGEYIESQQQAAVNKRDVTLQVLAETCRIAHERHRWLLFATGVEHANQMAWHLCNSFGVHAVPIHSKLATDERARNFEAFSTGQVRCAVAMNAMTTGIDIPEIDFIGMVRYTKSAVLWVQMLGRGGRVAPWVNKINCLVGDFTDNTQRLGPINDPIWPTAPSGKKGTQGAPVKDCPQCHVYNHASARICIHCGFAFPEPVHFQAQSSGLTVMRLGTDKPDPNAPPMLEVLTVDRVTYRKHASRKAGRPDSLLVSYFCGINRVVREYVCLEHGGSARARAERWWTDRSTRDVPATVEEAIKHASTLRVPTCVRVWITTPYPRIIAHEFP